VPDASEPTKELLLDEDGASGHDSVGSPLHDGDNVVRLRVGAGREHGLEMGLVRLEARVRDLREHLQDLEVPALVVVDCKRSDLCTTRVSLSFTHVEMQPVVLRGASGELTAHMQVAVEGASNLGGNEGGVEEQLEVRILCERHCGLS